MYIIIFIIILAALVFVHELGHFLAAKLFGIRVDEFALGFPPKIFSFTKGETKYALNAIPFGGYVKIFGEDNDDASKDPAAPQPTAADKSRSFAYKPKSIQIIVLLAGILFNIIFAWLLISLGFMVGMPVPEGYSDSGKVQNAEITITSTQRGSPAELAGLKAGDQVTAIDAADSEPLSKPTVEQIQNFTAAHENKPIEVTVMRGEKTEIISVTPTIRGGEKATMGVVMDSLGTLKLSFFPALWEGGKLTVYLVQATAVGITQFIGTAIMGQANVSDVTGPVGIAGLVNDATELGFVYLLSFTAFISINLAIINLVPFPALDGGRVLFAIIEKIRGKSLNARAVQIVNTTCLALLLFLMLIVTFHDITLLFK